jgi:hypothetical protein
VAYRKVFGNVATILTSPSVNETSYTL